MVPATNDETRESSHGVYEIELHQGATRYLDLPLDLPLPVVYVGQSWHMPEHRFRQHMEGGKFSSKIVVRNGLHLRPDLYGHLPRAGSKEEAEQLEAAHARTLAALGFHSYYDNHLIRPDRVTPCPESEAMQTEEHVNSVSDYIDQAIFLAMASLNRAVQRPRATPELVAEFLGPNGRGSMVPVNVPLPERGCFGYLNSGLILGRLRNLQRAGFIRTSPDGRIFVPEPKGGLN